LPKIKIEKQDSVKLYKIRKTLQELSKFTGRGTELITVYIPKGKQLHEVIQELEDNDHEEGTIVKEIAKGYIIRNEVMKYSKVCVSKNLIKK